MKALLKLNKKALAGFKQFLVSEPSNPATKIPSAANVPLVLETIANTNPKEPIDVFIQASLFYDVKGHEAFSMKDGYVPSDGMLTATAMDSVYSIQGKSEHLNNVRVHWVYPETTFESHQQEIGIKHFWTHYIQGQGGQLISYSTDLGETLKRIQTGAEPLKHSDTIDQNSKPEMIRYVQQQPVAFESTVDQSSQSLTDEDISHAQGVMIGLTWDCERCDVDLHVLTSANTGILNFKQRKTDQGEHLKYGDEELNGQYEFVKLTGVVDLNQVVIAAHLYSGKTPSGVKGEVAVALNNKIFTQPFYIPAKQGVKTSDVSQSLKSGQSEQPQTVVIDPVSLVSSQS